MPTALKTWEVYDDVRTKIINRLDEIRQRVDSAGAGTVPSPIELRIAEMYEFLSLLDEAPMGIGR